MRIRTLQYVLAEAGRGVRRNRNLSLVSVTTVAVCLILLALVVLLALNFDAKAKELESQVTIKVYLKDNTPPEVVKSLNDTIAKLDGVKDVTFINKDQALQELKSWLQNDPVLEGVAELNVLRESFRIHVQRPEQVEPVATAVQGLQGVDEVDYRRGDVQKLFAFTRALRIFSYALVGLLALGTVFLVSNTIRIAIFARRREIGIMKLVGATDWFIRWPFIVEGTLIGLLGALLSLIAVWGGYKWLADYTARALPFFALIPPLAILPRVSLLLTAVGVLIGILGSALSLRRFLRI